MTGWLRTAWIKYFTTQNELYLITIYNINTLLIKDLFEHTDISNLDNPDKELVLLDIIKNRVVELLDQHPELLFSYLYRLDIAEIDISKIINNKNCDTRLELAKLILERQKMRMITKKNIQQRPIEGWEW